MNYIARLSLIRGDGCEVPFAEIPLTEWPNDPDALVDEQRADIIEIFTTDEWEEQYGN